MSDMAEMYSDILNKLRETNRLMKEVKVNKKNCYRLDTKIVGLISTVQSLYMANEPISPRIYHRVITLLLDIQHFLKKCSVKSILGSFNKSKMQNKFNSLSQKLTDIMMDEPLFLPRENSGMPHLAVGSCEMTAPVEIKKKGRSQDGPSLLQMSSSLSFEDTTKQLARPASEELIFHWLVSCTDLTSERAESYAAAFVRRGLSSEAKLGRKLYREPNFLQDVVLDAGDARVILGALKAGGLIVAGSLSPHKGGSSTDGATNLSGSSCVKALAENYVDLSVTSKPTVENTMKAMEQALHENDFSLAAVALTGVAGLTEGSEEYQRAYGAAGGCEVIVSLLRDMHSSALVCETALRAVCWLSRYGIGRHTSSPQNISLFGAAGVCGAVVLAAESHIENEEIVFWACKAIMNLSSDMTNNLRFGEEGACNTVTQIFERYQSVDLGRVDATDGLGAGMVVDEDFCLQVWGALINLALSPENNIRLGEAHACTAVVLFWRTNQTNRNLTLWACMATQNLALNKNNKNELGLKGAAELVVNALGRFPNDLEISTQAFMAVQNLANNNDYNNHLLGDAGVCEHVVSVLRIHIADEGAAQRGCMALMNLTYNHEENRNRLVSSGVCDVIVTALQLHPDSAALAEFAFGTIVNLTDSEGNDGASESSSSSIMNGLGVAGVCECIVPVLLVHCEDSSCEVVAELGCWAIKNLAQHSVEYRTVLGALGAADAVCKSLNSHLGSSTVAEVSCWAIRVLAENNQPNSYKLGAAGACEDVVRALQMHRNNEAVVEMGCGAVQILAHSSDENRRMLSDADAYTVVTRLVKDHFANEDIESIGLAALASLSRHDYDDSEQSDSFSTTQRLGTSLLLNQKYSRVNSVDDSSSSSEASDVGESDVSGNRPRSSRSNVHDNCTLSAMNESFRRVHEDSEQDSGGRNTEALALDSTEMSLAQKCNVEEAMQVLRIAAGKNQSEEYCACALSLIAKLAEGNEGINQKILGESGACELIAHVMLPMIESTIVCQAGLEAICWMCRYGTSKITSNPYNVAALGRAGLCKAVVSVLLEHCGDTLRDSSILCVWSFRAITSLASDEANNDKLGALGACEIVLKILRQQYKDTIKSDPQGSYSSESHLLDVVKQGWGAIVNMALCAENNARIGVSRGCEYLASFLKLWQHTPVDMLTIMLIGVQNLALSESNRKTLGRAGVCDHVLKALEAHISVEGDNDELNALCEYGCMAVQQLTLDCENCVVIAQADGGSILLDAMNKYVDDGVIQEICCLAIANLYTSSRSTVEQHTRPDISLNVINMIGRYVGSPGCESVVEHGLVALKHIIGTSEDAGSGVSDAAAAAAAAGACEVVVRAIKSYRRKGRTSGDTYSVVAEMGCGVIRSLLLHDANHSQLMAAGARNVLTKAVKDFAHNSRVANICADTLRALSEVQYERTLSDCGPSNGSKVSVHSDIVLHNDIGVTQIQPDANEAAEFCHDNSVRDELTISSPLTLTKSPPSPDEAIEVGVPESLVLLKRGLKNKSELSVANALRCVSQLAEGNAERQQALGEEGACDEVRNALFSFPHSSIVCENGLRAVCYLSRYGQDKTTANDANNIRFGELELPAIIVGIMNAHMGCDKIALYGCKATMNLGSEDTNNAKLGDAGACETVVKVIRKYISSENVLKQSLWALINLALNEKNNIRFATCGCEVIITILQKFMEKKDITTWSLMAIQNLGLCQENRKCLGEIGVCELVVKCVSRHLHHQSVVEFGCMAIDKLVLDHDNRNIAGKCGACEVLLQAITVHSHNDMIAELGWKAVQRLARDNYENCIRLSECDVPSILVKSTRMYMNVEEVLEQALVSIGFLASTRPPRGNIEKASRYHLKDLLGEAGVCEVVVQIISNYTSDEAIVKASQGQSDNIGIIYLCLNAIVCLAADNGKNRERFGEYGACEKTIAAMTLHLGSEDIAIKACAAVLALSTDNRTNALKYSATGTNTVIFRVIQKNSLSKKVISTGFNALITVLRVVAEDSVALATTSGSASKRKSAGGGRRGGGGFGEDMGAFDIVVKILRIHNNSKEISLKGCQLLQALIAAAVAVGSGGNIADYLPGSGGGKIIMISAKTASSVGDVLIRCMKTYTSHLRIVRFACLTMCELAIESAYSAILGNLGACQVVISSLNRALEPPVVEDQDHLLAIECALRAVVSLATEASNMPRLLDCHAVISAIEALKLYSGTENIAKFGCLVLAVLSKDSAHLLRMLYGGVCDHVVGVLLSRVHNPYITEYSCVIITNLTSTEEGLRRVRSTPVCEAMVAVLRYQLGSFEVVKHCCRSIMQLCSGSRSPNAQDMMGVGIALVEALKAHLADENVIEACCSALLAVAKSSSRVCAALSGAGVGPALLSVLQENSDNAVVVSAATGVLNSVAVADDSFMRTLCPVSNSPDQSNDISFDHIMCRVLEHLYDDTDVVEASLILVGYSLHTCGKSGRSPYLLGSSTDISPPRNWIAVLVRVLRAHTGRKELVIRCLGILFLLLDSMLDCRFENQMASLNAKGLCEYVVECLVAYLTDAHVTLSACRVISRISSIAHIQGNDKLKTDFVNCNAAEKVVRSLRAHESDDDNAEITVEGCKALTNMCLSHDGDAVIIGNCGFSETSVALLQRYCLDESSVLGDNLLSTVNNDKRRNVVEAVCECLAVLASVSQNITVLEEAGVCEVVGNVLSQYESDVTVVDHCCQIVLSMASEDSAKSSLGQSKSCEGVISALTNHLNSSSVVRNACWAIMNLAIDDRNKALLGKCGGCTAVISAMSRYEMDENVIELAIGAVVNLADHNDVNKCSLCDGGIVVVMTRVLQRLTQSLTISELGLMAIVNLTDDHHEYSITALSNVPLFKLMLQLMRHHMNSSVIVEQGCWAIRNLCHVNTENAVALGSLGACDIVVTGFELYKDGNASVLEQCTAAISELIGNQNADPLPKYNIEKLSEVGVFKLLVSSLVRNSNEEGVVEYSSIAISRFFFYHSSMESSYIEGAIGPLSNLYDAVVNALLSHFVSDIISEHCCSILSEVYHRHDCTDNPISDWSRACEAAVNCLRTHYLLESVTLECLELLRLLAGNSREVQSMIGSSGGCEVIVTVLKKYLGDITQKWKVVFEACVEVIFLLSNENTANCLMFAECEVYIPLVEVLHKVNNDPANRLEVSDTRITTMVCKCIASLSITKSVRDNLISAGWVKILIDTFVTLMSQLHEFDMTSLHTSSRRLSGLSTGVQTCGDSAMESCLCCCSALVSLVGQDHDQDVSVFGGVDVPLVFIEELLKVSSDEDDEEEVELRENLINKTAELVANYLKCTGNVENMDSGEESQNILPLVNFSLELMSKFPSCIGTASILMCVVESTQNTGGKNILTSLPQAESVVETAVKNLECKKDLGATVALEFLLEIQQQMHTSTI